MEDRKTLEDYQREDRERRELRREIAAGMYPQHVERDPGPCSMGPRKVRGALCEDGTQRVATCSPMGADTFFSIPASVRARGKTVSGYITRETVEGYSTETADDPAIWRFIAYRYGKNAGAILRDAHPALVRGEEARLYQGPEHS